MEKGQVDEVVLLDSKSEDDDIEIVSETITNYGNCPTTVEVSQELQEKIRLSLEKQTGIPGKIKAIKVFATKKNKNSMSRIKDSFSSVNGKLGQVTNVCPIFDGILTNQVQIVTNNKSGHKRKHVQSLAISSEQSKTAKCLPQPIMVSDEPIVELEERPPKASSPVILYSPIQKGKQHLIRNESLQNMTPSNSNQTPNKYGNSAAFSENSYDSQNNSTRPLENSSEFHQNNIPLQYNVPLLSQNSNENNSSDQYFQYSQCFGKERDHHQDISKIEINANENSSRSQIIPKTLSFDPLLLDERDDGLVDSQNAFFKICEKSNPVKMSPITFSSDEEFELESSILEMCSSPKSSFEECLENFPKYKIEDKSSDEFYSIDDMLNDIDLDDSYTQLKGKDDLNSELEDEFINESENKLLDIEREIPNQNINVKQQIQCKQFSNAEKGTKTLGSNSSFLISKCVRVDIERLPKRMLKKEGIPPPWTMIFPPSPPSAHPPGWMSSENLWQLDANEFGQVSGLCGLQRAAEIRKQVNAPKPRVLRHKRQYSNFGK